MMMFGAVRIANLFEVESMDGSCLNDRNSVAEDAAADKPKTRRRRRFLSGGQPAASTPSETETEESPRASPRPSLDGLPTRLRIDAVVTERFRIDVTGMSEVSERWLDITFPDQYANTSAKVLGPFTNYTSVDSYF